jgi:hypothetical protein
MVYTGRIYDIVHVSDMVSQIILKKKDRNKNILVAIKVMGFWKDKAFNELKLKKKDKIRGNIYLKSNLYNEKYYTDVFFREIFLVETSSVLEAPSMFTEDEESGNRVDLSTGEVINEK